MQAKLGIVLLALSVACGGGRQAPEPARQAPAQLRAPALDGGTIDIERYRGEIVVIHLFNPSEPRVAGDARQLGAAHAPEDGVVAIGVALEPGGYPLVAAWRRGMEAEYLIAMATGADEIQSAHLGPLTTLPTTLVLDEHGRQTHRVEGPLEPGQLRALVAPLASKRRDKRPPSGPE